MNTKPALNLEPSWQNALKDELQKDYLYDLRAFLNAEYTSFPQAIYPPKELVFSAFTQTPYPKVRVLLIGQDPYHGPGQAHGLSFSVPKGIPLPPSLQNIFKEMEADIQIPRPSHGCLLSWAQQGVMLLNATLTVKQGQPLSHHGKGWERFTDAVVHALIAQESPIIFVLWGKFAQQKCQFLNEISNSPHTILKAPHPSPFSAHSGFFGSRPFSKINAILQERGEAPIDWKIN